jgi:hypothetical protein
MAIHLPDTMQSRVTRIAMHPMGGTVQPVPLRAPRVWAGGSKVSPVAEPSARPTPILCVPHQVVGPDHKTGGSAGTDCEGRTTTSPS